MRALITILVLSFLFSACSKENKHSSTQNLTVQAKPFSSTLFYSGTIQPISTMVVPSPVDGIVMDMPFQFGETVKKGQLLFQISSTKFMSDYKTALMQYIKAKSDFNNAQSQLSEAEFLHKNQLISDDDYKMKASNYYAARLGLLQAKDNLETLLHQLDIKTQNVYSINIEDIDKITQAMNSQMNADHLQISAPETGIILSPRKNDDEIKKIVKGDAVKQGDVLAIIGDLSGLNVTIKVNELTVNQLKVGQTVSITGIAFQEDVLKGEIKRIDRQGESSNGGLPNFSVEVTVPHLTEVQQKLIHVGMSAKVQIDIQEESKMMIPIRALVEKNGETYLKRMDPQNGNVTEVAVKTGKTSMEAVAILSGISPGDQIVIPN